MKTYWGSGDIDPRILDLGTRWGEWSASRPGRFAPRAVLDAVMKKKNFQPLPGLEPALIQPVAQGYTTELSRFLLLKDVVPAMKQKRTKTSHQPLRCFAETVFTVLKM
jgi:hypothetical protein